MLERVAAGAKALIRAAFRSTAPERHGRSRIAYFMLFRLAMLAAFTVLAGTLFYADDYERPFVVLAWSLLVTGYALTIVWALWLPRARDHGRVAFVQTASDIVLSAVVVQMTGGVDSGFVGLYLIAVLGAATMGGPRLTWAAAGACILLYGIMAVLEAERIVVPPGMEHAPLSPGELVRTVARTVTGLVAVSILSSYLNVQLARSNTQLGKVRALNDNIVRSLSSGLVTLDPGDRLAYFNPAARSLLDLEDGHIGESVQAVLPGLEPTDDGPHARQELAIATTQGREIRIGLTRSALRDAAGERIGSIIHFQDVTAMHELAQRLRRNERLAALGGLAASVAHEIRNPLAAISGSAELLGTAPLGDEDARLLAIIRRESTRLGGLIDDLLAYTRPRPPERRVVDLARAAAEVCEAFRSDPGAARLRFEVVANGSVMVELDPAQLSQMLWNLLRNAAEAQPRGGWVGVTVHRDGDDGVLEIADAGPGVPVHHLESIFDPFFTTKEDGTGFGLAVVHRTVQDNRGTIAVANRNAGGAVFTLRFPIWAEAITPADSGVLEI